MQLNWKNPVTMILIIGFTIAAVPIFLGIESAYAVDGNITYSSSTTSSSGFYAGLGTIYTVKTLDKVNIKVLRYHPRGQDFNAGKQPILLLPGMACNINTYLTQTTPRIKELYPNNVLPASIAPWAQGDPNIQNDPLLYYSLAYYLHKMGYDVWLLNYRGVGDEDMKSDYGDVDDSTIDVFAMYDARAGLNLVYQATGKHPVVGGHSTGGTVFMMLLEGCYFKWDGHVGTSASLVKQRNGDAEGPETIKGFIGLEPAGIPTVTSIFDFNLVWALLASGIQLNLRTLCKTLDGKGQLSLMNLLSEIMGMLDNSLLGQVIGNYLNIDPANTGDVLTYWFLRYVADTMYISMVGQYADWAWHKTIREYYQNGFFNEGRIEAPTPNYWDGYYYYLKNVNKWKVPSIFFLATMQNDIFDLVNKDAIIRDYVQGKTFNSKDRTYIVAGAHIEFPMGKSAPGNIFPNLGTWLTTLG